MMDPIVIRLECLRLAQQTANQSDPQATLETARLWADFVGGAREARILRAAKQFASEISQPDQ
jgi:hypothetical protein